MKKTILTLLIAFVAIVAAKGQQIAVVSGNGATTIYQTLDDAVAGAEDGSTVYLPGGGFPIKDETKIDKKLTIMGVSHRGDTDNVDGATIIAGNLSFVGKSSGSAVIGVYISGNINVGNETDPIRNLTIRNCNINAILVNNDQSTGMIVNQNYLRNLSSFGNSNPKITNNIAHSFCGINGGQIKNNIIVSYSWISQKNSVIFADNSTITNNVILAPHWPGQLTQVHVGSECIISNNMVRYEWGENCIVANENDWNNVFKKDKGVNIYSEYTFINDYEKYQDKVGIYAGTGFDDSALPPVPHIIAKNIPEQTDAEGKLNIKIRVKASE